MKLNEETQCIVQIEDGSCNAFLSNSFESGVHCFKFKINKCQTSNLWRQTLGIWRVITNDDAELPMTTSCFGVKYKDRTYGFANSIGKLKGTSSFTAWNSYGVATKTGDIIIMYCDLNQMELRFTINGKDYGKAFDIKPGKYKAVIDLCDKDDSITLVE